jgi:hypothetical protein
VETRDRTAPEQNCRQHGEAANRLRQARRVLPRRPGRRGDARQVLRIRDSVRVRHGLPHPDRAGRGHCKVANTVEAISELYEGHAEGRKAPAGGPGSTAIGQEEQV